MNRIQQSSRREFFGRLFSAGALVLGARVLPFETLSAATVEEAAWNPSVYLGIETDGSVIVIAHRSEMGTGIRSVLPMIVADEVEADWQRVKVEQAIGDEKYGAQRTDGSCSVRDFYDAMREAGAAARLMLERAAAEKWGVPASECKARNHQVVHTTSSKTLGFGDLAASAARQSVPAKDELKFKSPSELRYVGKDLPMIDRDDICKGDGTFGIDARMPGMVYASIERSPVYGGKLKRFDDKECRKVAGVQQTVVLDGFRPPHEYQSLGGVAVIADNTWAAWKGRERLKVDWDDGEHSQFESNGFRASLAETARKPQKVIRNVGDVDTEFGRAGTAHEAEYYVPLLAHAPMEPPAAVAEYKDGKVTAWAATQDPQGTQDAVSKALGIEKTDVTCHVTLLGGGFGRKCKPDFVVEAALLSKKVGKPVQVLWKREDDIRSGYFHTVASMYMKAAVNDSGRPVGWLQRSVFPTIGSTFDASAQYAQEFEMGLGWADVPYDIPNLRIENGPAKNPVRIGWMRSVSNIYHYFAIGSFLDELAHAAKRDRVEYLLEVLGPDRKIDVQTEGMQYWNNGQPQDKFPVDTARLRRVIELAAQKSNWAKKKPGAGRALGIAAHRSFLTYVAAVVEVEIDKNGKVQIPRVDYAVDAGTVIHPDRVKSQFEGSAVFGTSIALMGEINATNGRINQSNFHDYPVSRISHAPRETHVHLVSSHEPPAGVGEPGVPPIAPAICNAVFAATGKRIRDLPLSKHKLA